jgi:hypothetical protein
MGRATGTPTIDLAVDSRTFQADEEIRLPGRLTVDQPAKSSRVLRLAKCSMTCRDYGLIFWASLRARLFQPSAYPARKLFQLRNRSSIIYLDLLAMCQTLP